MILHARPRIDARLQVAQTLPIRQLRKTECQKMIKHREPARTSAQRMQRGATRKSLGMQAGHDLGKNRAGRWHLPANQRSQSKSLTPPNQRNTLQSLRLSPSLPPLNWTAVSHTKSNQNLARSFRTGQYAEGAVIPRA